MKKKYYVVWYGHNPGIYESWEECATQVKGFSEAVYMSFSSREEAEQAFQGSPEDYIGKKEKAANSTPSVETTLPISLPPEVKADALAVDAACSGNPGAMEYRGVYLATGQTIFHFGPVYGTNNIGEFLAIVHALALLKQRGRVMPVYSDSHNALLWVKKKQCKTTLQRTERTEKLFQLIERAEKWLRTNDYSDIALIKWQTQQWGEVPADFGRK